MSLLPQDGQVVDLVAPLVPAQAASGRQDKGWLSMRVIDVVCPTCDAGAGVPCANNGRLVFFVDGPDGVPLPVDVAARQGMTGHVAHLERWEEASRRSEGAVRTSRVDPDYLCQIGRCGHAPGECAWRS